MIEVKSGNSTHCYINAEGGRVISSGIAPDRMACEARLLGTDTSFCCTWDKCNKEGTALGLIVGLAVGLSLLVVFVAVVAVVVWKRGCQVCSKKPQQPTTPTPKADGQEEFHDALTQA